MNTLETPLLFIIFNRPETTKLVFDEIRKARPSRLFIAGDGPRLNFLTDEKKVQDARKIVKNVDWPCEVKTNFQDKNLGCKYHVSGAISWFFQNVQEGIILEDDCLPNESFFLFCRELLEKYRNEESLMHISGTTFLNQTDVQKPNESYHFSNCTEIWGWATWRRAWEKYDLEMKNIEQLKKDLLKNRSYLFSFIKLFKHIKKRRVDTWDAQWQYTVMFNHGLTIMPHKNLISNIGFSDEATHTRKNEKKPEIQKIVFPLVHPMEIVIDEWADKNLVTSKFSNQNFFKRAINRLLNN